MLNSLKVLFIGLAVASIASASMYKWTDPEGNVHYGDHPPPGADPAAMKPAPVPDEGTVEGSRERWDSIRERQQRSEELRREQKARQQEEQAERKKQEVERKRRCARARSNLHALEQQRPVFTIDDTGERVYYDAGRRAREAAELRKFIEKECR